MACYSFYFLVAASNFCYFFADDLAWLVILCIFLVEVSNFSHLFANDLNCRLDVMHVALS